MVDVRVTQDDGVYPGDVDRERLAIAKLLFCGALYETAFE